jgi:hypothetical protein
MPGSTCARRRQDGARSQPRPTRSRPCSCSAGPSRTSTGPRLRVAFASAGQTCQFCSGHAGRRRGGGRPPRHSDCLTRPFALGESSRVRTLLEREAACSLRRRDARRAAARGLRVAPRSAPRDRVLAASLLPHEPAPGALEGARSCAGSGATTSRARAMSSRRTSATSAQARPVRAALIGRSATPATSSTSTAALSPRAPRNMLRLESSRRRRPQARSAGATATQPPTSRLPADDGSVVSPRRAAGHHGCAVGAEARRKRRVGP